MTPDDSPDSTRHPTWGPIERAHGSGAQPTAPSGDRPARPGSGRRPLGFFGLIEYSWRGVIKTAVATPAPSSPSLRMPAVVIGLCDAWVTVGRPVGGTELVAWESVRDLRGWAAVPNVVQRLTEPTHEATKRTDSSHSGSDAGANSHQSIRHYAQVRQNTLSGESRADDGRSEP